MKTFTFRGLMAPVFTPFKTDLSIDTSLVLDYARNLMKKEIRGILVNGTSGEGTSLSVDERKLISEAWIKAAKETKQHVMIQVGGAPMPDVHTLAKHAEEIGADSLLCLPDLYIKPQTYEDLALYLKSVASSAPNTPLLYYHIPMFTNVNLNMGIFLRDYACKIPTFAGIKFTSTDLDEGYQALKANGGKYAVFLGADTLLLPALSMGFDSAIGTTFNFVPELSNDLLKSFKEKKLEESIKIQDKLTSLVKDIIKNAGWVPAMKAAMNEISDLKTKIGPVREPLRNMSEEHLKILKEDIKKYKL